MTRKQTTKSEDLTTYFEEAIQKANKHMKRYYYICIRMVKKHKTKTDKC